MIELVRVSKTDERLKQSMADHYSKPLGFVGRQLIYRVEYNGIAYGFIAAGSATKNLPGRDDFLRMPPLNNVINNTFFHIEKVNGKYPVRNFAEKVVDEFVKRSSIDWTNKYKDDVYGFETLVELPRTGEIYRRAGWTEVGLTKGFTCKRTSGESTDSWGGRRVWGVGNKKRVFCLYVDVS